MPIAQRARARYLNQEIRHAGEWRQRQISLIDDVSTRLQRFERRRSAGRTRAARRDFDNVFPFCAQDRQLVFLVLNAAFGKQ